MRLFATDPLFAWLRLEDHPQLSTLAQLLQVLPDQQLLDGLRSARGAGAATTSPSSASSASSC
jgi:hypothetical protein